MPWPLILAAITAASELQKNKEARAQADRDRQLSAQTEAYSPWTGLHGQRVQNAPSALSGVFSAGAAGYGQMENANNAENAQDFRDAQLANINAQTKAYGGMGGIGGGNLNYPMQSNASPTLVPAGNDFARLQQWQQEQNLKNRQQMYGY